LICHDVIPCKGMYKFGVSVSGHFSDPMPPGGRLMLVSANIPITPKFYLFDTLKLTIPRGP
jgi:hypothetical protein